MRKIRKRYSAAFTLIELVAVCIVLSILTAVALPKYQGFRERAVISEAQQVLGVMYRAYQDVLFRDASVTDIKQYAIELPNTQGLSDPTWPGSSKNWYYRYNVGGVSLPWEGKTVVAIAERNPGAPMWGGRNYQIGISTDGSFVRQNVSYPPWDL